MVTALLPVSDTMAPFHRSTPSSLLLVPAPVPVMEMDELVVTVPLLMRTPAWL
jgi:hypothetical protein